MTPALLALARRAVACRGFRWMEGMATEGNSRVQCAGEAPAVKDHDSESLTDGGWCGDDTPCHIGACVPDLSDPATVGLLLVLVEDIYEADAWCEPDGNGPAKWAVYLRRGNLVSSTGTSGATRAEALVAALEAAPEHDVE